MNCGAFSAANPHLKRKYTSMHSIFASFITLSERFKISMHIEYKTKRGREKLAFSTTKQMILAEYMEDKNPLSIGNTNIENHSGLLTSITKAFKQQHFHNCEDSHLNLLKKSWNVK
jgi:hypothetical protein